MVLPVSWSERTDLAEDGWNLVSNPYPSVIDWDYDLVDPTSWTKTNIESTIYFYSATNDRYCSYNHGVSAPGPPYDGQSQFIASSQAFLVHVDGNGDPALTINENAKSTGGIFVRSPQGPSDHLLRLSIIGNGYKDGTVVRFKETATDDFDGYWDARKFFSGNYNVPNLATVANAINVEINTLPLLVDDVDVPLLVKVGVSGTYKIRMDSSTYMPGNSCLILEDLLTHTFTDLRTQPEYSFYISNTTVAPRFVIHFGKPIEVIEASSTCSGASDGMITAKGNGSGPWDYTWKDESGNVLQTHPNVSGSDDLKNIPAGTYTVIIDGNTGLCSGVMIETIIVTDPEAILTVAGIQNTICKGDANGSITTSVTGGLPPYSYNWSNGDTTATISNIQKGNYSLNVTDSKGCSHEYFYDVLQSSTLHCAFNMNTDTVHLSNNNPVVFSNNSIGFTSSVWNFGDGASVDTSANPVYTYLTDGTYFVSLTVSDGSCFDTLLKKIIVTPELTTEISQGTTIEDLINVNSNGNSVELIFDLNETTNATVEVFNAIGEQIFNKINKSVYKNRMTFDFSEKAKGAYFIKIQAGKEVIIKKILK